jgi:hypothetical protein
MRVFYPLSDSKMQCSLLFRERGVVAGEKVGSWQRNRQEHSKDDDYRKIPGAHGFSERLDAEHSNRVVRGRGRVRERKQDLTHCNIKQKPESKILSTNRKAHKARTQHHFALRGQE